MLVSYPWPGNVRELKNQVKRLVILGNIDEMVQYLKGSGAWVMEKRPWTGTGGLEIRSQRSGRDHAAQARRQGGHPEGPSGT